MKYQILFFLFQKIYGCREFKELCGAKDANFYKKKTYDLRVIKLLVLGPNSSSQKTFYV